MTHLQTFCEQGPKENLNVKRVYERLEEVKLNICTMDDIAARDEKWQNWAKENIKKNSETSKDDSSTVSENLVYENNVRIS